MSNFIEQRQNAEEVECNFKVYDGGQRPINCLLKNPHGDYGYWCDGVGCVFQKILKQTDN